MNFCIEICKAPCTTRQGRGGESHSSAHRRLSELWEGHTSNRSGPKICTGITSNPDKPQRGVASQSEKTITFLPTPSPGCSAVFASWVGVACEGAPTATGTTPAALVLRRSVWGPISSFRVVSAVCRGPDIRKSACNEKNAKQINTCYSGYTFNFAHGVWG